MVLGAHSSMTPLYVDDQNERGETPIHVAVEHNRPSSVKLLCEAAADLEIQNEQGSTGLHLAAALGNLELVDLLAGQRLAPIDTPDEAGNSALHNAAQIGCVGVIQRLLSSSASSTLRNDAGETAVFCAVRSGYMNAASLLIDAAGSDLSVDAATKPTIYGQSLVHAAASSGNFSVLKAVTSRFGSLRCDTVDSGGNTPLHLACIKGNKECIELLLILGANTVTVRNDDGKLPSEQLPEEHCHLIDLFK
eukprot:TRINITY_DN5728_c0_g1_i2.p1 TRINITY_DN5728_c0_g1~~TRINITY_DN5728_c0_g1_i2.p1  ORF type:complete len:249 (-),score=49.21 TRINITY_DN5728_c0_g1_i2:177-923(-)